jgi:hypothetical protein
MMLAHVYNAEAHTVLRSDVKLKSRYLDRRDFEGKHEVYFNARSHLM